MTQRNRLVSTNADLHPLKTWFSIENCFKFNLQLMNSVLTVADDR